MRALLILVGLAIVAVIALMMLGMISLDGGRLPRVAVQPGEAPKVDVGRIDVGTVNKTVAVPVIDVQTADNAAAPAR